MSGLVNEMVRVRGGKSGKGGQAREESKEVTESVEGGAKEVLEVRKEFSEGYCERNYATV